MTLHQIYKEYAELNKPYGGNATLTPEQLHSEVMRQIGTIGNSNPHWNRLNEIESDTRYWVF